MFVALKAFRTTLRKVGKDDRLYHRDDLSPHTLESLIEAGLIENKLDPKPEKKSVAPKAPVEPAPEPETDPQN